MWHQPRRIWPDIIAGLFGVFAAVGRVAASDSCLSMPVTEQAATAEIERRAQDGLAIASVNMAGNPRIGDALASLARDRGFDVLLLQEVGERSSDGSVFVATLGDRLGYHVAYAPA